jgi:hypothetical protein
MYAILNVIEAVFWLSKSCGKGSILATYKDTCSVL